MLKEILLKNFEAHDYFRVKLDPHITSFTGESDIGKSSILRGFEWVALNLPLGDSFIGDDESKPAYAAIKTDKGIVSRKKGKGINIYKVNGMVLEGFGSSVPEEVKEFLNIEKLNFQFQFDAPYWFMISPGKVGQQLNQIVGLEIIDTSLTKLKSKVTKGKTAVTVSKDNLNEAKSTLSELHFVKPMVKDFSRLEKLEIKKDKKRSYFDSLAVSIREVGKCVKRSKMLRQAHSDGVELVKIGNQYKNKVRKVESLSKLIKSLEKNMVIVELEIPDIQPLVFIANKWKKQKKYCDGLSKCIDEIILERKKAWRIKKELALKEKELKKLIGKTCPLCGNQVTK